MPINFGTTILAEAPKLQVENSNLFGWWRFLIQTALSVGIGVISNLFAPGVGVIFEAGAEIISDLLFDLIENNGKFDLLNFGLSTALNLLPFANKGIKLFSKRAKNKFYGLAENIADKNSNLKKALKQNANDVFEIGTNKQRRYFSKAATIPEFEKVGKFLTSERGFHIAENGLDFDAIYKTKEFKHTKTTADLENKIIKAKLENVRKKIFISRQIVSSITSPFYLGKKLSDLATRKAKRNFNKKINNYIQKVLEPKIQKKFKFLNNFFENTDKAWLPLNSSWIRAIRIIKNNEKWNFHTASFVIKFNPATTNNKKALYIANKNVDVILGFLTAESPGAYYIDNFAWGWEIGKLLRERHLFFVSSKIPLFQSALNTIIWTSKTFTEIIKSLKKEEWEWNQPDFFNNFSKGVLDNLFFKGWRIKYLTPSIYVGRGIYNKNSRYFMTTGLKSANKLIKSQKIKPAIQKYRSKYGRNKK